LKVENKSQRNKNKSSWLWIKNW